MRAKLSVGVFKLIIYLNNILMKKIKIFCIKHRANKKDLLSTEQEANTVGSFGDHWISSTDFVWDV